MIDIKTVTVVGATGTMGVNVAGIFASFGNAKVFCVARDIEKVKKTIPRIVKSVRADSIAANLIPDILAKHLLIWITIDNRITRQSIIPTVIQPTLSIGYHRSIVALCLHPTQGCQ
jgi:3-hydroxyacyl-CoA dehydrogenase